MLGSSFAARGIRHRTLQAGLKAFFRRDNPMSWTSSTRPYSEVAVRCCSPQFACSPRAESINQSWVNCKKSEGFARTRRRFSASAATAHGHIEPPKPGEEYVQDMFVFRCPY